MTSTRICGLSIAMFCFCAFWRPPMVAAQPFCGFGPPMTLTAFGSNAEILVVGKWIKGVPDTDKRRGTTEFEIVDVIRRPDRSLRPENRFAPGDRIGLGRYEKGQVGALFLVMGSLDLGQLAWDEAFATTPAGLKYRADAPSADAPVVTRLRYRVPFLDSTDESIAHDVACEFDSVSLPELTKISKELPRLTLRRLLATTSDSSERIGVYGLMLGLCGNDEDAKILETKILDPIHGLRPGIEGVMQGYLLLTGDKGLTVLDEKVLSSKSISFAEIYGAIQSVRLLWKSGNNRIRPDRLRQSMRILLDRPELADLVIADLTRMNDWSVQERLMELYDSDAYNNPHVKRAIVRYMLTAANDTAANQSAGKSTKAEAIERAPEHVAKALVYLARLEKQDPDNFERAKRYFRVK